MIDEDRIVGENVNTVVALTDVLKDYENNKMIKLIKNV